MTCRPTNDVPQDAEVRKLRTFHWSKLSRRTGTVWCSLPAAPALVPQMAEMLESLFRNPAWAGASSSKSKPAPVAGGPEGRPTMIDIRRANNVSIMMTRFKAFPGGVGGMMHAVLSFQGLTWEEMGLIRQ
ncbi:unnamed protein product, partial [Ostreobium quekettii]